MSAYAATARIERVTPRLVIDRGTIAATDWPTLTIEVEDPAVEVAAVDAWDPLVERLSAVRERWSQLTFYLFDAESWR
jgi:hypothetical protein